MPDEVGVFSVHDRIFWLKNNYRINTTLFCVTNVRKKANNTTYIDKDYDKPKLTVFGIIMLCYPN